MVAKIIIDVSVIGKKNVKKILLLSSISSFLLLIISLIIHAINQSITNYLLFQSKFWLNFNNNTIQSNQINHIYINKVIINWLINSLVHLSKIKINTKNINEIINQSIDMINEYQMLFYFQIITICKDIQIVWW